MKRFGKSNPAFKHGQTDTLSYRSWSNMLQRCYNPANPKYVRYGGRGIVVCERWMTFSNFFEDMGRKEHGQTLGRINNDGNYCPENCEWQTPGQQANNKSNNRLLILQNKRMTSAQWAKSLGISYTALRMRLHRNWSIERALHQPQKYV